MFTLNNFTPINNKFAIAPKYNSYTPLTKNNKYPNLAPLKQDTVSFGRSEKDITSTKFGISLPEANKLHQDSQGAKLYLEKQLSSILGDSVSQEPNDHKSIQEIAYRVKTPKSIREKSMSRRCLDPDETKKVLTDIVGARIIMKDSSTASVDNVIKRLAEAERDNKLKIIEIENYRPEPEVDDEGNIIKSYDYSSPNALRKLKKVIEQSGTMISKKDEDIPTGYMAIHLLTKLPNGFTGEIQILGTDIADLKEVEDLCYKVKSGKSIDKKYESIKKILKPLTNKDDLLLRREFNKYTRNAYIYQREMPPDSSSETMFLPIPKYLPQELDFNNIYKLMRECDK